MPLPPRKASRLRSPEVWVFTTYFAEGLPYSLIRVVSSVFFRDLKVSLEAVGLTSLFGLPWVIKFLWGPHVDRFSTKRRWLLVTESVLVGLFLAAGWMAAGLPALPVIGLLLFVAAFIAATHDMAIDGYYLEALDEKGQARFVGYRVLAYRIAMMAGTGGIVTIGTTSSWPLAFVTGSFLLAALLIYHLLCLGEPQRVVESAVGLIRSPGGRRGILAAVILVTVLLYGWGTGSLKDLPRWQGLIPGPGQARVSGLVGAVLLAGLCLLILFRRRIRALLFRDPEAFYTKAFLSYVDRERIALVLAFIVLLRTGESLLTAMVSPFMVDLGIKVHLGWISGGVGLPCSIAGALLGGWLISRFTLRKTIWPFLLAQNLTNLIYMALAFFLEPYLPQNPSGFPNLRMEMGELLLVAGVHGFDQFAGGLGTSVLVTFLMRTCLPEFKAAHFAIGSGLMNLSGVFAGAASGFLASWAGYGWFFGLSFLASLPGMALIPFLPFLGRAEKAPE
jgi:PAT family beta-lactamase induction signal transducer AmpG